MQKATDKPEVYIHPGMGKTASTFLQYNVFPRIRGLHYIQRTRFRRSHRIIEKARHPKYLVSGELDNRFMERYLKVFTATCPYARPIYLLRRHDEWIVSQYKRYVKNGNRWTFTDFFDLEKDTGAWKKQQLEYYPNILLLEEYFDHKPLILFYDDLRKDPERFIQDMVEYMGAGIDLSSVNLRKRNASYSEKQVGAVYHVGKFIPMRRKKVSRYKPVNVLVNLFGNMARYSVLNISLLLPASLFRTEILQVSPEIREQIRNAYEKDWQRCVAYAVKNNPELRARGNRDKMT